MDWWPYLRDPKRIHRYSDCLGWSGLVHVVCNLWELASFHHPLSSIALLNYHTVFVCCFPSLVPHGLLWPAWRVKPATFLGDSGGAPINRNPSTTASREVFLFSREGVIYTAASEFLFLSVLLLPTLIPHMIIWSSLEAGFLSWLTGAAPARNSNKHLLRLHSRETRRHAPLPF